jgi:mono/diheme cytochrome c family protein
MAVIAGLFAATLALAAPAEVTRVFEDACVACHDGSDPTVVSLASADALVGLAASNGRILVEPGAPDRSYLVAKLEPGAAIDGDPMPMGGDPLPDDQRAAIRDWIAAMPATTATEGTDAPSAAAPAKPGAAQPIVRTPRAARPAARVPPFKGADQIVLPTTTTLGKRTMSFTVAHRFGRMGTERGAFGLDAGAVMSLGLAYGIVDGWDIRLRRSNSHKAWELATKYVPVRQEAGAPLSVGAFAAFDLLRGFDTENRYTGSVMAMVSRLWFERWSTMLTVGYHFDTNHSRGVVVDLGPGLGPRPVVDKRDTLTLGVASTVWLGKKRRWGLDLEWLWPVTDRRTPNGFFYRGGDAAPGIKPIGAWTLGTSFAYGKHIFQVFVTNNREIHLDLAAPGGQTDNPFGADVDSKNPFHKIDVFLGFNLVRKFKL